MPRLALLLGLALLACTRAEPPAPAHTSAQPARASASAARPARDAGARWVYEHDEAAAFARARAEHRGVMVDVTAAWCEPCAELEQVLARPELASTITAGFVPLRLDVSQDSESARAVRARYHADTLPQLVFVASDGTVLARVQQALDADQLLPIVKGAVARLHAAGH